MIKKLTHKILLIFCFGVFVTIAFAQETQENAQPTKPQTTSKNNTNQQQQMLQEIKQLQRVQAKQRKELGLKATQAPSSAQGQAENQIQSAQQATDTNQIQQRTQELARKEVIQQRKTQTHVPKSNFQYPFQKQQIQNSSEYNHLSHEAFAGAVRQAIPLSPTQVHRLKQIYNSAQFAAAAPAGVPPKPTATSLFVNLAPGSAPPAIRLSEGFVSSLVFLDSTGAPWPIAAYDLGNPSAFNIVWDKKDNILMVQAKTLYTYGNLAVRLRGLNTPVMLTLIPGQSIVDYRVDITVPGYGPDAKQLPINTGLPPQATPVLLNVLDGVPPNGSKTLTIDSVIGKAWELHGKMYLRTKFTLLSPGWLATMASADGTKAYELQKTPMLLVAKNGKVVHVKIGGF